MVGKISAVLCDPSSPALWWTEAVSLDYTDSFSTWSVLDGRCTYIITSTFWECTCSVPGFTISLCSGTWSWQTLNNSPLFSLVYNLSKLLEDIYACKLRIWMNFPMNIQYLASCANSIFFFYLHLPVLFCLGTCHKKLIIIHNVIVYVLNWINCTPKLIN